jgi:hypothetical protein
LAEPSENLPAYLFKEGVLAVDPGSPEQRAARLLELIGEATFYEAAVRSRPLRVELTEADEYYDELDMAELDFLESEGYDPEYDE